MSGLYGGDRYIQMQRLLSRGMTCRIYGTDDSGFRLLSDLRDRHLRRAIFLPAVLRCWRAKLRHIDSETPEKIPPEAKETLRRALGLFVMRQSRESLEPVTVRHLPRRKKLFTVLKGPHIDKKAREQFFFTTYGVEMTMKTHAISAMMFTEMLARFYETGTNELHITARF